MSCLSAVWQSTVVLMSNSCSWVSCYKQAPSEYDLISLKWDIAETNKYSTMYTISTKKRLMLLTFNYSRRINFQIRAVFMSITNFHFDGEILFKWNKSQSGWISTPLEKDILASAMKSNGCIERDFNEYIHLSYLRCPLSYCTWILTSWGT